MAVNQIIQTFALASAVAANGTVVVGYPTFNQATQSNLSQGNFSISDGNHTLKIGNNIYRSPADFTLTFNANASGITVTNKTAGTWPAGSAAALGLDMNGGLQNTSVPVASTRVVPVRDVFLDLGSPNAASATAVCTAQAISGAANATLNGAIVASGVAYTDVPRNLVAVSSNAGDTTQVLTVTGKDEYGATMVENITLNGTTSVAGNKAFATVTRVAVSGAMTGNLSVGTGVKLGLPLALRKAGQVIRELQDGAAATAGTFAYAASVKGTATSADVRGTYTANAAPDGSKGFLLGVLLPDPSDIGFAQFAG